MNGLYWDKNLTGDATRRDMTGRNVTAGAGDDPDGVFGCGENDDAEPPPARTATKANRGHRERVRGGNFLSWLFCCNNQNCTCQPGTYIARRKLGVAHPKCMAKPWTVYRTVRA